MGKTIKRNCWFLYLIRCADSSLYTGIATDVLRRLDEHRNHPQRQAKYLRGRGPLELVFSRKVCCRSCALRLEYRIKRMTRATKEQLVTGKGWAALKIKAGIHSCSKK